MSENNFFQENFQQSELNTQKHQDEKKNLEEDNEQQKLYDQRERYKFYTAKRETNDIPTLEEKEIERRKVKILKFKSTPEEAREEDLKYESTPKNEILENRLMRDFGIEAETMPELIKEIEKAKKRIIEFGKQLGIDVEERLENKDIYLLNENVFLEIYPHLKKGELGGVTRLNDILIKNLELSIEDIVTVLQHELIHMASTEKHFLNDRKSLSRFISMGYFQGSKNDKFMLLNEALTEITNLQIFLNNDIHPESMGYTSQVIFLTELSKDLAQRISKKESQYISQKDILTHLQRGMFQGEKKYLGIIIENYGSEAFKALTELKENEKSEDDIKDMIELSQMFNLPIAVEKIKKLERGEEDIVIDIGDKQIPAINI